MILLTVFIWYLEAGIKSGVPKITEFTDKGQGNGKIN